MPRWVFCTPSVDSLHFVFHRCWWDKNSVAVAPTVATTATATAKLFVFRLCRPPHDCESFRERLNVCVNLICLVFWQNTKEIKCKKFDFADFSVALAAWGCWGLRAVKFSALFDARWPPKRLKNNKGNVRTFRVRAFRKKFLFHNTFESSYSTTWPLMIRITTFG